jgi:hypothetical protein
MARSLRRHKSVIGGGRDRRFSPPPQRIYELEFIVNIPRSFAADISSEDVLLETSVWESIRQCGRCEFRNVEVCCESGIVYLDGTLDSFYLNQVVQEATLRSAGVQKVVNRIHVRADM